MVELKYKANGNPQGKPRVYFSSHPDDFSYFDKVANDILKKYDCAIIKSYYP